MWMLQDATVAFSPEIAVSFLSSRSGLRTNNMCWQVDLLKKRAGQQMELDATLPKHAKKIRSQYQELFETLLETYRGKQVQ